MKQLFSRFSTRAKVAVAALLTVAVAAVAIPMAAHAGFGPGRVTKVYNGPGTPGFTYPVFNSFTNVPGIGDERTFFTGMYPSGTVLTDPLAEVKDGDTLTLQVYVHNDADPSLGAAGTAQNTTVRVALPSTVTNTQQATAYIDSSNTNPKQVYDTLDFAAKDGSSFQVEYVPGSAHVRGNYIDTALGDNIVTSGVSVGTDALNGQVKGCFQQEVMVTLKVRVKVPHYTVSKKVGVTTGTTDWKESVNVDNGAAVSWAIQFHNDITGTPVNHVKIVDNIPAGITVTPGSVKLINGNYPNGYTYPDSAIQANGSQINVDIGNYNANSTAYVVFKSTAPTLQCGNQTLINKAYATPEGFGSVVDTASVTVDSHKVCNGPSYSCDVMTIDKQDGRKVHLNVKKSMSDGVTARTYTYNFGDGSTPLVTDKSAVDYQYAKDGTYKATVNITFRVNGEDKTVTSESCSQTVTFGTTVTPPPTTVLPDTGAGDIIGIFAAATLAGAIAHRFVLARRYN